MTTETFDLGDYTLTTTYAYKRTGGSPARTTYYYYIGQRVILTIQADIPMIQQITINDVTYYTDNDGKLLVDMTDDLRDTYFTDGTIVNVLGTYTYMKGIYGIDPESILMPLSPLLPDGEYSNNLLQIMPPSVIYQHHTLGALYDLQMELRGDFATSSDWQGVTISGGQVSLYTAPDPTPNILTLPCEQNGTPDPISQITCSDLATPISLTMLHDCDNVCVLRWLSQTGIYKQAIWRVKKIKVKATEVELLPMGDGYKQQRGSVISFIAYIDGLDAYSAAYYSDIIIADEVHCAMRGGEDLTDYTTSVRVENEGYTLADGDAGETQTLEVTINYRQYDAI